MKTLLQEAVAALREAEKLILSLPITEENYRVTDKIHRALVRANLERVK